MDKAMDQQEQSTVHKHSKLLLIITVVVLLIGAGLTIYFVNDTNKSKVTPPEVVENVESVETETTTSSDTLATAKEELDNVNIQELKLAVAELKTALAAFSQ